MSPTISPADFELLSAYMDKQLTPNELARVEARLAGETQLAVTLKDLQRAKGLLRRAPQRRVPHSFALTRQMVEKRTALFAGWTSLNFASAVATLLLVFAVLGDFSINGASVSLSGAAPAAENAPQTLMAQAPTATPEIEMFAQDRQAKGTEAPLDLSIEFALHAHQIELALGAIALASGLLAWRRRHL